MCFYLKSHLIGNEPRQDVLYAEITYMQPFCGKAPTPSFTIFMIMWPLFASNFPWIRKNNQSNQDEEEKGRFERKSLQKLLGVAGEEKKEQSRGPAYISLSSNSFMSSKLFQRPELLCLCCALKSLAGLYEERQWEHFRKSYKGSGRAEEERKSEWHHW